MKGGSRISLPSGVAKVLAFLAGAYASAPGLYLVGFATTLARGLVPHLSLITVYSPLAQAALMVTVNLALGWYISQSPVFKWVVIGFIVVRVVPLVIGTGMAVVEAGNVETPFMVLEIVLLQSAALSIPPLAALFAGAWLRRRSGGRTISEAAGEEPA